MGRPPHPLGVSGKVRLYRTESGWRARTTYRDHDGVTREVQRHGRTKATAERALAIALRDRCPLRGELITPETRLRTVAEKWYAELEDKSPSTMQAYRHRLDRQILPALGQVKVRELSVGLVDRHLAAVKEQHGAALAKMTKSVLSGVCGLAARHDALSSNPCRDVARISTKPKKPPSALTVADVKAIRAWLMSNARAHERDLPDLVAFLSGTGLRIGEALAVLWSNVDLDAGTVTVRGTVLRLAGQGLIISRPKTAAGERVLELPRWCIEMLKARGTRNVGPVTRTSPVFAAPVSGKLRDPSNTRRMLRQTFAEMGMRGVTSHQFRKTVATLMDDAGLSARQAADQLGHANVSVTLDVYMGRRRRATGAAQVLEQLG